MNKNNSFKIFSDCLKIFPSFINKLRLQNNKAFTLVELLIVIVIIAILAGVVITVINPIAQQNRAKDAVIVSSINKIVLATQAYISAYGVTPKASDFFNGLTSASTGPSTCNSNTDCLFTLTSAALPSTCSSTTYLGNGTIQCNFYYVLTGTSSYNIVAKAHGSDSLYVYRSSNTSSKMQICPNSTSIPAETSCRDL